MSIKMEYNSLPRCRNHEWRVVRHRGSDGDEYKFEYNLEEGDPLVTDGQGRTDRYLWGPLYDVYKHVDALGNCWRALPVQVTDGAGRTRRYSSTLAAAAGFSFWRLAAKQKPPV